LKLSGGDLFVTVSDSAKLDGHSLKHGGLARRRESIDMLANVSSYFLRNCAGSIVFDNGLSKKGDKAWADYAYPDQLLSIESDLLFCLDSSTLPSEEIVNGIFRGMSGFYSIGLMTEKPVRESKANSSTLERLHVATSFVSGVIFSVFDSEAFGIWCRG
jgi:hypothetical protein